MIRIHHPDELIPGTQINLYKDAAHHLVHVMRIKQEDAFIIFNSSGEFEASVLCIDKKNVSVTIGAQRICETESICHITLLQAISRRERMDFSVQKATELGVACIQPVLTEHCVVKLDAKKAEQRINHWLGIARHATEQSGRLVIPEIKPVLQWNKALEHTAVGKYDLKMIFALSAAQTLGSLETKKNTICLAIGPVGGFSEREVELAKEHGFHSIKLGPRILRAETATTAALTAIQMRWGDMNFSSSNVMDI